ncbi:MAG: TolC family protein [Deltaproteobacteria bacterium]|nr:TolC family protein [Deltaproteobacteria bacterium]
MKALVLTIVGLLVPAQAAAETGGPLGLTEVLESTLATHPKLADARARIAEVQGQRLAVRQAFEPKVVGSALALPAGFYEYWQMAAKVQQTLPVAGIKLEGGYRLGRGDIPPYYGERVTRDGGELFARLAVPLLADRSIDKDRAAIRKATVEIAARDSERVQTWIELARDATLAYWDWVAAGQRLRVALDLRRIAQERATRINAQADSGALPRITKVDNDRVLFARQSSVLKAEAQFTKAQAKLSLYYRERDSLRPIRVPVVRVPEALQAAPAIVKGSVDSWLKNALRRRPDLRVLDARQKQVAVDMELADNRALPNLDLGAFVARDLGDGSETLGQTDVGVGVQISIPLFRRQGRGLRRSARAKLASIEAKRRGLRDRIAAELKQAAQVAKLSRNRYDLARKRLQATERLANAERRRLAEGASDVLVVNLRELDVASAAADAIDAALEVNRAVAELIYAQGGTRPARSSN